MHAKSLQSCPTLCNPMDCSPPGSSVHGILQARILVWVAMPSSSGIFLTQGSNPRLLYLLHRQVCSLPLVPPGKSGIYLCNPITQSKIQTISNRQKSLGALSSQCPSPCHHTSPKTTGVLISGAIVFICLSLNFT